jgi:DNA-binding XRE family transcriptional regulator
MKSQSKRDPISGAQVRAARAFLGWTARALAKKADVAEFTLEWIEGHGQISGKDLKSLAAIQARPEAAGIEFTEDEGIPGLRLHPRKDWSERRTASPARSTTLT